MEAISARINRLLELAKGTHPQPDTLQRFKMMLMGAAGMACSDTTFAASINQMLDVFIDKLSTSTRVADDLTASLQATRRLLRAPAYDSVAQLASLHGNDLFRALMTLQLPATTPPEIYLEVALAAQRLIMHDRLDKFIHLYEKILFPSNSMEIYEDNIMVFMGLEQTLEKFVQEHIDLANAAISGPPTTGTTAN